MAKKAYLDYNIFASLEEGVIKISDTRAIDAEITQFPFSASHIQEAYNIVADSPQLRTRYIEKRLETINGISQGCYIYNDLSKKEVIFLIQKPQTVYETISYPSFGKTAMKGFMNLVPGDQKENFRNSLGIDPKEINNYSPGEVIAQLNTRLVMGETKMTFIEMIEKAISFYPPGQFNGLHNKIGGMYELLDMLGYWKDRETPTSNYARMWDASHAHFASHCDYFISDDKRNRNKAKVVYDIFKIPTRVISSNGS